MYQSRKQSNFRLREASSRSTKSNCEICQNKFQMLFNQQHQCKRCWRAICINCSPNRIKVFQTDGTTAIHKICKICQKDEEMINALIKENKLIFQLSSKLSEEWMRKINKERLNFQDIINQYEQMKFQSNSNTIKFKSQSKRLCEELFTTYHYSLRQFIGKITQEIRNQTIYQSISNVMVALFAYLKAMPFIPELIYLVVFLLCFCSEFQCYFIISRFIQKIYPQYLRIEKMKRDNLLSHQLKTLLQMYKLLAKRVDKEELSVMASFLQSRFLHFVKSFTINLTNISISFFVIDGMFTNSSYIDLYKGIASTIYNSRQIICERKDMATIDNYILSEVSLQQIKNSFMLFQKSGSKFQMDHQFFDSAQHRILHQKYKQLQSLYNKSDQKLKSLQLKYKSLAKQYEQNVTQLSQANIKTASLQEQIINLADKMIFLQELQNLKEQNQLLIKNNTYANQTIKLLQQKLDEVSKKYTIQQNSRKMYINLQQDYENQIVQLKTKNQVYQIQKLANDINFSTSFIDQKFEDKNKQILQLQRVSKALKDELEYYKNQKQSQYANASFSRQINNNQTLFNTNLSFIPNKNEQSKRQLLNFSSFMNSSKEQKESFKKLIQSNKDLIQSLKNNLKNMQQKNEQLQKQVSRMRAIIENQKNQISVSSQISHFMKQVPQEINYTKSISDFQKTIAKQQNLHRKAELELILFNFRKCVFEIRYRTIDSKIKQNKIRELTGLPIHSDTLNSNSYQKKEDSFEQHADVNVQDITAKLSWISNQQQVTEMNKLKLRQQTCQLM